MRPPATPSVKFTYDDLLHFADDGRRHEIVDGERYVTPSPNTRHQAISFNLSGLLWAYLKEHPIGRVFAAPFDVVLSDFDVVEPDLLYISRERWPILPEQHVRGAPDLAVEILSPGTRKTDEVKKRELYERFGVREYWVIDPDLDTIKVYRRVENAFVGDVLATPLLPGFSARLTEIFASPL